VRRYETLLKTEELEEFLLRSSVPPLQPAIVHDILEQRGAASPTRRVLYLLAKLELIPMISAVEDPAGRSEKLIVPAAEASLERLLRALGYPSGYLIEEGSGVHPLRPIQPGEKPNPILELEGRRLTTDPESEPRAGLERRLREILRAFAMDYRRRLDEALKAQLPVIDLRGSKALFRGHSLSVWLEHNDRLSIRRALRPWTLQSGATRRHFRAVELRVHVDLERGRPRICMPATCHPAIAHPFVDRGGQICVAGWMPVTGSWTERALALIERAEEVMVLPSNPDGRGGHRTLSACPES
jgi:hypothetical protein